jgi:hypothetical protein
MSLYCHFIAIDAETTFQILQTHPIIHDVFQFLSLSHYLSQLFYQYFKSLPIYPPPKCRFFLSEHFQTPPGLNVHFMSVSILGRNAEFRGSSCFADCKSVSSITFESNSRLRPLESGEFSSSSLQSILVPPIRLLSASGAIDNASQITLVHEDFCSEFD